MKFVFMCTLLLSVGTLAAPMKPVRSAKQAQMPTSKVAYKVITFITIDGVKTSSSLIVAEGQKGAIQSEDISLGGRFTEILVNKTSLDGKPGVQMEFVVGEIDAIGTKTVLATPKILTTLGEKASVLIGSTPQGKKLILTAVATRL